MENVAMEMTWALVFFLSTIFLVGSVALFVLLMFNLFNFWRNR
jgi:hypothetical protein